MQTSMVPQAAWFKPQWDVDLSTTRVVAEGVWRAERRPGRVGSNLRHAVYFNPEATIMVSLAIGELHGFDMHDNGGTDYETYVLRAGPHDGDIDVCCHGTEADAERCAIGYFGSGQWCRRWDDDE